MEALGIWMQVVGAVLTGVGLVIAWYRISDRFQKWRNKIDGLWISLRRRVEDLPGDNWITPDPALLTLTGATSDVFSGSTEDRITHEVGKLNALIGARIKDATEPLKGAINSLAKLSEDDKFFVLRDFLWAIGGFIIATSGLVIENWSTLLSSLCQCV